MDKTPWKNVFLYSQMLFHDTSAKNDTFRIFYAKLFILLSVGGSNNRRKEIIFGGYYNYQIRYFFILESASFEPRKCRQVI